MSSAPLNLILYEPAYKEPNEYQLLAPLLKYVWKGYWRFTKAKGFMECPWLQYIDWWVDQQKAHECYEPMCSPQVRHVLHQVCWRLRSTIYRGVNLQVGWRPHQRDRKAAYSKVSAHSFPRVVSEVRGKFMANLGKVCQKISDKRDGVPQKKIN